MTARLALLLWLLACVCGCASYAQKAKKIPSPPSPENVFTLWVPPAPQPPCGNFGAQLIDGRCRISIIFSDTWEELDCKVKTSTEVECTWKPLPSPKEKAKP